MADDTDADRLARMEVMLRQHQGVLAAIRGMVERLAMQQGEIQHHLLRHDAHLAQIQQTLDAIKEMLDRGNGH